MWFYYSVMKANIKKEEPRCAQMTIFYDGKVIVFDDVPADKAKDIMVFSSKGITSTSQNHNNNYAYSSFLARNSANNSLQDCYQVPSIPVIYGNFFWIFYVWEGAWFVSCFCFVCVFNSWISFLYIQIYQWLGKLHFIGSWRKGRIGRPARSLSIKYCLIFLNRLHFLGKPQLLSSVFDSTVTKIDWTGYFKVILLKVNGLRYSDFGDGKVIITIV